MNMITNLKVHNSKLEEKAKTDHAKYKKIEWFYQHQKAKKYRNQGT